MTRMWTGLRTSAFVLAIGTLAASAVEAAPIIEYNTSGTVDPVTGITSPNGLPNAGGVISFRSIPDSEQPGAGSVNAPSSLSLGQFQVAGLTNGSQVNYSHTPFAITFIPKTVDGKQPTPNETPTIRGWLDGTVTGSNKSDVVATFDTTSVKFQTGDFLNTLTIPDKTLTLVPSTSNLGRTSAQANIVINTPEPTSIAIFVASIAALGLRRRFRASR